LRTFHRRSNAVRATAADDVELSKALFRGTFPATVTTIAPKKNTTPAATSIHPRAPSRPSSPAHTSGIGGRNIGSRNRGFTTARLIDLIEVTKVGSSVRASPGI